MAIDRYHRQTLLPQIGSDGQARLGAARILLVGCGALGATIAELLTRAGVGFIRIADRDIVEWTNLQRQVLFDESDAREGLPKAIAAGHRLRAINSSVTIEPKIVDVSADGIETLAADVHLILDGTDNVATRYLINDVAVKNSLPWIYGACIGTEGRVATIRPGDGPCLRCIFPTPPDPRELATCDTAGVLGPVASVVGSMQAIAAMQLIVGRPEVPPLFSFDLWTQRVQSMSLADARDPACATCGRRKFEFLEAASPAMTGKLCGSNAVQVQTQPALSLSDAARRLQTVGTLKTWPFMLRCSFSDGGLSLTLFEDGRAIVHGTADVGRAKSTVARYLGS